MVDLHCHILADMDDGAQTMEDSIEMAKEAINNGIQSIVATPHYNHKYQNEKQKIVNGVKDLNDRLLAENIPLTIYPGQEVRIYGDILQDYYQGKIQTLCETQYLFIEFPADHVPKYAEGLLYTLLLEGIIPIIVHPERNAQLIQQPDILYNLVDKGALTQITSSSVCGHFGKNIKKFTQQIIEANLTHFVASDAHNITSRSFRFNEALDVIEKEYGMDMVYLLTENAQLVVDGQNIYKEIPTKIKRKKILGIF